MTGVDGLKAGNTRIFGALRSTLTLATLHVRSRVSITTTPSVRCTRSTTTWSTPQGGAWDVGGSVAGARQGAESLTIVHSLGGEVAVSRCHSGSRRPTTIRLAPDAQSAKLFTEGTAVSR